MKVYAITDIGRVRTLNEDSYYLPRQDERFCAVADGMGGHNAGEVASAMAVQVFSEYMREVETITGQTLHAAVARANSEVYRAALDNEGMSGMGTTFSALAQQDGDVLLGHVGDSRIYLVRHGAIMQLTTDHTLVEEMVRKGMLAQGGPLPPPAQHHHPRPGHRPPGGGGHHPAGRPARRRVLPVQRRHDQLRRGEGYPARCPEGRRLGQKAPRPGFRGP